MEIKITTRQILQVLNVLSWIIFIGLCFDAGSFIFNAVFTMVLKMDSAGYFGLSSLYEYDRGYFLVTLLLMSIAGVLKTLMFYLIVKILMDKKLNISQPFDKKVVRFILKISYLALGIGLFSSWGSGYKEWLVQQGVKMPDIQSLHLGGADVWLFMGVILIIIAQIFKRGVEIQSENELTI
jgi:hypothetical protein